MLLLAGCVQPGLAPGIEAATRRVLDALGIECCVPPAAGCCGAIRQHLDDARGALEEARRNIDAWWPLVEAGAEALVVNASGCGVMVREYGHLLRDDPAYAARATRIAALACDLAELVQRELPQLAALAVRTAVPARIAFHPPCTLQHGLRIVGVVEAILAALGAQLRPFPDAGQCCGSAGTYSLLQAPLAERLRQAKIAALEHSGADLVLSANVGCIEHLAGAARLPVRHWIEWVDERIAGGRA
ncbi:MAG: glycolate oxidase subunit GlcF [Steroidobacteraceae bacterium]